MVNTWLWWLMWWDHVGFYHQFIFDAVRSDQIGLCSGSVEFCSNILKKWNTCLFLSKEAARGLESLHNSSIYPKHLSCSVIYGPLCPCFSFFFWLLYFIRQKQHTSIGQQTGKTWMEGYAMCDRDDEVSAPSHTQHVIMSSQIDIYTNQHRQPHRQTNSAVLDKNKSEGNPPRDSIQF